MNSKFNVWQWCLCVFVAAFLAGAALSQTAFSREPVRVLVLPFEMLTEDSQPNSLGDGMAELLSVYFSQMKGVSVVERDAMEVVLKEHNMSLRGISADQEMVKVGKIIGAQDMVSGSIHKSGESLEITARIFDVSTGQVISVSEASGMPSDLAKLARHIAVELSKAFSRFGEKAATDFGVDESPLPNWHFMEGLSAYYSARYDRAVPEFIQASQEPTNRYPSRFWLAKSFLAQKQYAHAYAELNELSALTDWTQKAQEIERMRKECEAVLSDEDITFIKLIGIKP